MTERGGLRGGVARLERVGGTGAAAAGTRRCGARAGDGQTLPGELAVDARERAGRAGVTARACAARAAREAAPQLAGDRDAVVVGAAALRVVGAGRASGEPARAPGGDRDLVGAARGSGAEVVAPAGGVVVIARGHDVVHVLGRADRRAGDGARNTRRVAAGQPVPARQRRRDRGHRRHRRRGPGIGQRPVHEWRGLQSLVVAHGEIDLQVLQRRLRHGGRVGDDRRGAGAAGARARAHDDDEVRGDLVDRRVLPVAGREVQVETILLVHLGLRGAPRPGGGEGLVLGEHRAVDERVVLLDGDLGRVVVVDLDGQLDAGLGVEVQHRAGADRLDEARRIAGSLPAHGDLHEVAGAALAVGDREHERVGSVARVRDARDPAEDRRVRVERLHRGRGLAIGQIGQLLGGEREREGIAVRIGGAHQDRQLVADRRRDVGDGLDHRRVVGRTRGPAERPQAGEQAGQAEHGAATTGAATTGATRTIKCSHRRAHVEGRDGKKRLRVVKFYTP